MSAKELGARVRRRRHEAGMDLTAAAAIMGVSPDLLEAFEEGRGHLRAVHLVKLARTLGVPPSSLLHSSIAESGAPASTRTLFSKVSAGEPALESLGPIDALLRRARDFAALRQALDVKELALMGSAFSPEERPHEQGYRLASQLRASLPEREGPIHGLRRLMEDRLGILVSLTSLESAQVLGLALRSGAARLLVVNEAVVRKETTLRFVLCHEVAHHLADLQADRISGIVGLAQRSGTATAHHRCGTGRDIGAVFDEQRNNFSMTLIGRLH